MHKRVSITLIGQTLLLEAAIVLALWMNVWWLSVAGMFLLAGSVLFLRRSEKSGWIGCALAWAGVGTAQFWENYAPIFVGLIAAAVWLNGPGWRTIAMAWSFLTAIICIGIGYRLDSNLLFFLGFLATIGLVIGLRAFFKVTSFGILVTNTILFVMVGLPMADFLTTPSEHISMRPEIWPKYYSFQGAKGDPATFANWWRFFYEDQYRVMQKNIFDVDTNRSPSHRLRPGSHVLYFLNQISINSQGFRGPEIPAVKGNTYRIVALGESTTFGMTLGPDDKPWPELLEQMIAQRLKLSRPVEVINAGVPGYGLIHNVPRLTKEILRLKPDMIISYHGYNGFGDIDRALPPVTGPPSPDFVERPLNILASCEYRIKMRLFRNHYAPQVSSPGFRGPARPLVPLTPLQTEYAGLYQQLIAFTETNRIELALANYSMAVNSNSPSQVIAFYQGAFPLISRDMAANETHSILVKELAAQHPEICLVDTHPNLDGENEKFIDVMHLTQEGRRQMAENMFAGIRGALEKAAPR